jgi:hypothetical protein
MEQRKLRKRQRNSAEDWKTQLPGDGASLLIQSRSILLTIALPRGFLMSAVLLSASVIYLFLKLGRKIDESANFVFAQLIEQGPGIND